MNVSRTVLINKSGGYYAAGCSFPEEKWVEILDVFYRLILENEEKEVSPSMLAAATKISWESANKAIIYGEIGLIPPGMKQGHGRVGIGAMVKLEMHHHLYIYELYLRNPSRPLISYCEKLERKYDKKVSKMTISRWF